MNKQIITNVCCVTPDACMAETFHAEINDALALRIIKMAAVVKLSDAYSMCFFNYEGAWSEGMLDEDDYDFDNPEEFKRAGTNICNNDMRVEIPMLHVMKDGFKWVMVPKHCDDSSEHSTPCIPLSFLESDEEFYLVFE